MISAENLYRDVAYLTEEIGIRLAGSQEERLAAEYLKSRFLEYVPKCTIEEFPVACRVVEQEELAIWQNGAWQTVPAMLFNGAPGTDGKTIEADVVYFDSHTDYQRADISYVKGKGVVHWGLRFGSEENYRRMMEAEPAFLMMVDTRYTSDIPLGDGLFPAYVKKFGAVPTVNVAFFDAWNIVTQKIEKVRLTVKGGSIPAVSSNVVAEIPGTLDEPLYFYCGGHLDTQSGTVGADDNAIGCAVLLELARVLSQKKLRHTVRLIAFGAEEQLSVGSASYIRAHREEISSKGRFVWNFDSCSSAVGWNRFLINTNDTLRSQIAEIYHDGGVYYEEIRTAEPTIDLFPFTAAGVPGFSMHRRNCEDGTFFHHRPGNALENISTDIVADIVTCAAKMICKLDESCFDGQYSLDPMLVQDVANGWQETFGGW